MPPLQALVALHAFWGLALVPFAVWAVRTWPPSRLRFVGRLLGAGGLTALVLFVGHDLLDWCPGVTPEQQKYMPQRIAYALGTSTDFPVVQVAVTGAVLRLAGRRRKRTAASAR
jgi:hypothetical protein